MLRLATYRRAADLLADAGAWLAEREAEHNLILGIAGDLAEGDRTDAEAEPYLALIRDGERPVLVALRTPPWNLLLSEADDPAALRLLADELFDVELPGVTGPPTAVERFGDLWARDHGVRPETTLEERIYRVSRVVEPPPPDGAPRRAAAGDRAQLADWLVDFQQEALPNDFPERLRDRMMAWDPDGTRQFWLWEVDGRPVSMASAHSPTPTGIRIGPVYTPPAERGHGYASALTAFVSRWNLDRGRRFCFLYTDLANRTANRIYQAIGYEPVTDARMIRFIR